MRKFIVAGLMVASLCAQPKAAPATVPSKSPKLVLGIVVDQFRYDYLTRFRGDYTGGFKRLLEQGAVFTNAHYDAFPMVTAVGHSTFFSGAPPALSGIIGDVWWDRDTHKNVTSVSDDATKLLGASGVGSSPRRMLPSTLGDELKLSGKGGKVVGVSIKDRSAILSTGHMADGAYWYDVPSGNFVSSTYYFPELPGWAAEFNQAKPSEKFAGLEWMGHKMPKAGDPKLYAELTSSPYGNELIQQFALKALGAEKLGTGAKIDEMVVSYSSNDYVGHRLGPDSPEVRDMAIRTDKLIGDLLRAAEAQAGAGRVVVVLTADHGIVPLPELNQTRKMPGGRIDDRKEREAVEQALTAKFGAGPWIAGTTETGIYLNPEAVRKGKAEEAQVERAAAEVLRVQPHMFRVYTRAQLLNGGLIDDQVGIQVRNGFNSTRSPDVIAIHEPYWISGTTGVSHGAPFGYDSHVPVIFWGAQIRTGRYNRNVTIEDIAPTLATILDVETPSGSAGRVLDEILK